MLPFLNGAPIYLERTEWVFEDKKVQEPPRTPEQGGSRPSFGVKTYYACSKYIGAPIKKSSI